MSTAPSQQLPSGIYNTGQLQQFNGNITGQIGQLNGGAVQNQNSNNSSQQIINNFYYINFPQMPFYEDSRQSHNNFTQPGSFQPVPNLNMTHSFVQGQAFGGVIQNPYYSFPYPQYQQILYSPQFSPLLVSLVQSGLTAQQCRNTVAILREHLRLKNSFESSMSNWTQQQKDILKSFTFQLNDNNCLQFNDDAYLHITQLQLEQLISTQPQSINMGPQNMMFQQQPLLMNQVPLQAPAQAQTSTISNQAAAQQPQQALAQQPLLQLSTFSQDMSGVEYVHK